MRLLLDNFRCHAKVNFNFSDGKIILLSGPSGIGKSTILQAIAWVLYGGLKNILSNTSTKKKCCVTISFDTIEIYRQKGPNLLRVTFRNNTYEGEEAQSIIDQQFGNKSIWYACSYIGQNQRSPLLSATNAEKMEILNQLSFSNDDPEVYINKISEVLQRLSSEFGIRLEDFKREVDQFNPKAEKLQSTRELPLPEILESILNAERENEIKLIGECSTQKLLRSQRKKLSDTIESLQARFSGLSLVSEDELERSRALLGNLVDYRHRYRKFEEISIKLRPLEIKLQELILKIGEFPEVDESRIAEKNDQIRELEFYIVEERSQSYIREKLKTSEEKLRDSENELQSLSEINESRLSDINNELERLRAQKVILTNLEAIEVEIRTVQDDLDSTKSTLGPLDPIQYETSLGHYREFVRTSAILTKYSIDFNLDRVRNRIEQLTAMINNQEPIRKTIQARELDRQLEQVKPVRIVTNDDLIQKRTELNRTRQLLEQLRQNELIRKQIADLGVGETSEVELRELQIRIERMIDSLNIHSCPHCSKSVRWIDSKLVPSDSVASSLEEIEAVKIELAKKRERFNLESRLNNQVGAKTKQEIETELGELEVDLVSMESESKVMIHRNILIDQRRSLGDFEYLDGELIPSDSLRQINLELHELSSVKEVSPITLEEIEKGFKIYKENQQLLRLITSRQELQIKIRNSEQSLTVIKDNINRFEIEVDQLKQALLRKARLIENISEVRLDISNLKVQIHKVEIPSNLEDDVQIQIQRLRTEVEREQFNSKARKLISDEISRIYNQIEILRAQIPSQDQPDGIEPDLEKQIQRLEIEIKTRTEDRIAARSLKDQINVNEEALNTIDLQLVKDSEIELERNRKSISQLESDLELSRERQILIQQSRDLERKRQYIVELDLKIAKYSNLKKIAIEIECQVLDNTVNSINTMLESVTSQIFDSPIRIVLQLHKTIKSTNRVKPTVNFSIQYKGGIYDNINQLSGGEADRVSLAVTLALARLNICPFILLDECIASLDSDLREDCVKTFRSGLGKTIICVNHESIEGHYDEVVKLE